MFASGYEGGRRIDDVCICPHSYSYSLLTRRRLIFMGSSATSKREKARRC